jgi:ubiquinol-cytochrome c reductase cytochrome c1 subunit
MIKKLILLIVVIGFSSQASMANEESPTSALHPKKLDWEFEGFFGRFDKQSIQRGYQVYKEVCSACHSMKLVAYRNLQEIGFPENEVKQIASEYMVMDGPDDSGEMFERAALPSDHFAPPFANEQAARSANGGALPPDLSLIVKARHEGANYVYSLLTGFAEAPEEFKLSEGKYYNPYFAGRQISMTPPLPDDGVVEYKDGTIATKEQMAIDVVNFLQFAAEPEMETRKQMGVKAMTFLAIMTLLFAIAKKLIWKKVK